MSTQMNFLVGWAGVAVIMLILWFAQWRSKNAGIVDVAWAFGTGVLAIWLVLASDSGELTRKIIIALMAAFWGVRLGIHLSSRVFSESEDGRYRYMREQLGSKVQPVMFGFFQIQALWAVMFALPMWAAAQSGAPAPAWHDIAGVLVFVAAMTGEAIADAQLSRFRKNPDNRGKVCRDGLWRYSRHPNYFFEWIHWFAYVLIGIGSPWWWVTVVGVIVMYIFLTRITGIPFTEQQSLRSRGDAYRRYQQTTSAFFPRPPDESKGNAT